MQTFKNTTQGSKGINLKDGSTVYVAGGETSAPLDVSEGELAALEKAGWFEVSGGNTKAEPDPNDLSAKTVEELKALATAETIDLGENTKKADIIAAIQLAREEKDKA